MTSSPGKPGQITETTFRSTVPHVAWPALPGPQPASLMALLLQWEKTQWWPPEALVHAQFSQLAELVRHAAQQTPYYRRLFRDRGFDPALPLDGVRWSQIPVLTRRDVQEAGDSLRSAQPPRGHGKVGTTSTSGSTATPVTVYKTMLAQHFWNACQMRDYLWHGIDLSGTLAIIRLDLKAIAAYPDGNRRPHWGPLIARSFHNGPSAMLSVGTPIAQQAEWLQRQDPDYFLTFPTNLAALLRHCEAEAIALPRLKAVQTIGELLSPETRELCRAVWNVPIHDIYSTQEIGYVALQCPEHEHYHVQSETVLVEVLDAEGTPCAPGAVGRVVVTPLHNFATPLLRYVVGDYAMVGEPCPCGRGLPVLTRIMGRVRNLLTLPSGDRVWPRFGATRIAKLAPVIQFQLVQKTVSDLELRTVAKRPLTPQEEDAIRVVILGEVGEGFTVAFSYHDEIKRSAGGKFEDFVSELTA